MKFMTGAFFVIDGARCYVTRSGYTGGDGFEISTPADAADAIARKLLAQPEVKPIGLGARDSLRLEAGLCLYGHDIDTTTTPIEAGLLWSIGKERRAQGGFPGAAVIQKQIAEGAPRKRVGLLPEGKAIAREGAEIAHRRQDASARSRRAASRPRSGAPSPWATSSAPIRPTAPRSTSSCAASPCRPRSCPCPSSNTPTTADRSF